MKKTVIAACLFCAISASAQVKKAVAPKTPAGTTKTSVASKPATSTTLKNLNDSASYAMGISFANFYVQQGFSNINVALVNKAIDDVIGKKKVLLSNEEANMIMMKYVNQAQEAKAKGNIEAGEKFLAQNKTKPGVKTTESGLQYEVIKEGTGAKPLATDTVTVHYAGTLLNGEEFDNSYKRGEPISLPVNGVIRGWTEALQLMPLGSKYKLYIPYQLGYGTQGAGAIPPGSVLIFEVELLKINDKSS
ncbi:FKBP-type peptidyl-prolyl cis-trans isomerase [Chitinophagaceae bacterium LB-8]|uniref:Peptidyl-prolyl cis-trans isomerase n=1 Tax=Paraflavisolibacter caeni TaxID=2982496 RepID=A0A9X3BF47_9BACT|nr:FKBP-type peptidyl-prolyl cis-trans isomerase [Paraflavisolibacter caeni]MCU7548229.1 FKBP-type peptidyl-prolyl cis-trans isomerase [Paraflavisolibacter caeni]